MIAFLTQYYRGLGHAMRIKYISDCLPKDSFIMINQLFNPPIKYNTKHTYFLEELEEIDYRFLLNQDRSRKRARKLLNIIENNDISVLVCEGFPFCRQQFSYEYLMLFEKCKEKNIKIVVSIRDFPWDEPHQSGLQDWVSKTINYIVDRFDCTILLHGDEEYLALIGDSMNHFYWSEIIKDIKERIIYTGYVCSNIKPHKRINNNVYISCGLNKEESFFIYEKILKSVIPANKDLNFIVPLGSNELYSKIGSKKADRLEIVNYIDNLYEKLQDCAGYITYGGYNSTTDILKSKIPSVIIPRQDGKKIEQIIRCFMLKPYNLFKVCSYYDIENINGYLQQAIGNSIPDSNIKLDGAEQSANIIRNI
jgi:predicted glycosyltransferase